MADPIADNAQLAVDELRRKARRRLIGAIVLALAAATLLPLLLEQEQKPLGDDVSVQIPPIDDGKFVTRLPGDKAKEGAAGKSESKAEPKSDAKPDNKGDAKAETKAEPKVEAKNGTKADSPAPKAEPKGESKAELKAESKSEAKAESKSAAKADAAESPTNAATAAALSGSTTLSGGAQVTPAAPGATIAGGSASSAASSSAGDAPGKAEGFIVQLGAFTDTYGANALANRLKKAGYPAFTEPTETSRGKMWRVRVGGYPTRAAANEARDKLKADGHNGIVVAAR